jgi:HK97 family phage prohead protease
MSTKEIRSIAARDAAPQLSDDGKTIVGYGAVFNSFSQDLGGFYEIIKPGAFDRALAAGADVRGLVDHDASRILGRTKSGTMKLSVDAKGLRYEITPPDTTTARDLMTSMKRGDVDGSSFAFSVAPNGDNWRAEGPKVIRELTDVDLFDVSVVTYPAYLASEASLRSLDKAKIDAGKASVDAYAAAIANARLRLQLLEKE